MKNNSIVELSILQHSDYRADCSIYIDNKLSHNIKGAVFDGVLSFCAGVIVKGESIRIL